MNYIIIDLEWNQPADINTIKTDPFPFDSEIIEIGAVKLDEHFDVIDEYRAYVKPVFYTVLRGAITRLTKITNKLLEEAETFPAVCSEFFEWCGQEYEFMSWGPDDVPVLMDNMLTHNIPVNDYVSYDLQRIFCREILRENRQCSLERAVEILGVKLDRSHDALNDCRNTARVSEYLNLDEYLDEYAMRYLGYENERRNLSYRKYENRNVFLQDKEAKTVKCPYCGENAVCDEIIRQNPRTMISCARCDEGDEVFVQYFFNEVWEKETYVHRILYEMTDDLWEIYEDQLEQR